MDLAPVTWVAIIVCVSQSAMFSGLNLAFFSLSRLRLEVEAASGNLRAANVLELRKDPNLVLTTVLLGNVSINVLLTLLSDSVLAGVSAFFFSTIVITAFGEILPQAYFSRNALRVAAYLSPLFRFYRFILYPIAKPAAWLLDRWLGKENLIFFREREMRHLIKKHIEASDAEIDRIEGLGALNFLAIDDIPIVEEGEPLNPNSVLELEFANDQAKFPSYTARKEDAFLLAIQTSGEKWVVFVDQKRVPRLVMDADAFLRGALFSENAPNPMDYCHRPIVVTDPAEKIGAILSRWQVHATNPGDNVIDQDLILFWNTSRKVITGADVLGRLLMGIAGVHQLSSSGGDTSSTLQSQ